jgi:hypothetical protein
VRTRLLLAGLGLLLGGQATGQGLPTLPANGTELFRFALHKAEPELKPVTDPGEVFRDPLHSIIIVVGNTDNLARYAHSGQLKQFVIGGGSLLIATDGPNGFHSGVVHPAVDPGWGTAFGINITGRRVIAAQPNIYAGEPTRPFVRPKAPDIRLRELPPYHLFAELHPSGEGALATNGPSEMQVPFQMHQFQVSTLAGYPPGSRLSRGGIVLPDRDNFAFALTARQGRMLVLADRDVFANGMMGFRDSADDRGYRLDNANWEFAKRTIAWLQTSRFNDPRTKCLFIEDGNVVEKFADKLTPPTPPFPNLPPDVLANILLNNANPIIDEAQKQNYFNRMVQSAFGFNRIVRFFLILCTILFLFFGLRWLRRAYRKAEPAVGNPAQEAARVPRGGVVRQRTTAQIEVGNLYEAASRRIRDRFDILGGRPAGANTMPPVLVAVDVADAPILRHTVGWLWQIGYGDAPVAVPPVEWDRVNGLLERVTARAARGDWTFGADAS